MNTRSSQPETATLRAHAKLTLRFRITGVRDDGFHLIDAEMVTLNLFDLVHINPCLAGLRMTGPHAFGVPEDERNLAARALDEVGRSLRDTEVVIDKRIPCGGGLGGGSADAAAVLRWAGVGTDPAALARASRISADVSFCLVGGRARVEGIGEIVAPLDHVDQTVTLIIPPLGVSTPAVYRAWDAAGGPTAEGPNDLEPAATVVVPELRWWRDAIKDRCGQQPVLAGSGATWFVHGERTHALADLVAKGAEVIAAQTIPATTANQRDDHSSTRSGREPDGDYLRR